MTLKQWVENGWLRPHKTSRQEISNLLAIVPAKLLEKDVLAWLRSKHPDLMPDQMKK